MRDDELRSLVLGVVLVGLLMAGGVWAFMRWGTPPDAPQDAAPGPHHASHAPVRAHASPHAGDLPPLGASAPIQAPEGRRKQHRGGAGPRERAGTGPAARPTPPWPVKPHQPAGLHGAGH
ncbi:MAG: hypothetical protein VKQ33_07420 [Candidatus Sericytochromatia bacterium]|nr:hypothetical protein [Candidatus Sericytochromatia bacterium]